MKTKIFCLILNYRRLQDTHQCVKHLTASDLPPSSKIVIIDNSPDISLSQLKQQFPDHTIIKNQGNLGFAAGNNVGIRYALDHHATHILIINPDVRVPRTFFKPMLKTFAQNPKLGILAPALKHTVKNQTFYGLNGYMDWTLATPRHHSVTRLTEHQPIKSEFLTFACVLIKADLLKEQLLDERYFMYLEDVDFCLSAAKKGYQLILDPNIVAQHQTSASFSHPRQKLKISFISHLKFILKWLPFPHNLIALTYQSLHYPYLYLLWTYHHWRYRSTSAT